MNNGIIRKIYRTKTIDNLQSKIKMLGSNRKITFDATTFLTVRIISTILLALALVFLTNIKYYFIPFIVIGYYYLFYHFLITNELNKRIKKLDNEALTFFEILTLTLESGKNLENSLEITCYNIDSELSSEFKKSLLEMKFGKSLMEALSDLRKRIPSENINNIILNIKYDTHLNFDAKDYDTGNKIETVFEFNLFKKTSNLPKKIFDF